LIGKEIAKFVLQTRCNGTLFEGAGECPEASGFRQQAGEEIPAIAL